MRYKIMKWYKVIAAIFSAFVSTIGLVLSILGIISHNNSNADSIYTLVVLIIAESFMIFSVVYSVISFYKDKVNTIELQNKIIKVEREKVAVKTIFENNKSIVATYKDCNDQLNSILEQYIDTNKTIDIHNKDIQDNSSDDNVKKSTLEYTISLREKENNELKRLLIQQYNRFLGNISNLLRRSIEEYLVSKDCNEPVSITIKQLSVPTLYKDLDKSKVSIYTAFRDYKTYSSKKRNETWKKEFSISKNSDFIMSIEKEYYIFNFMDKKYLDDGLYLNENSSFYENYNSGITCTIHSCIDGERKLFGYLACDSLLSEKTKKTNGKDIYDWNIANLMMFAAHVIAMYLDSFLKIWANYCIYFDKNMPVVKITDESMLKTSPEMESNMNFCKTMQSHVMNTRYNG